MSSAGSPPNSAHDPLPRSTELMRAGDTALLMVDMQQRLLPAIRQGARVQWNCGRLLQAAKLLGVGTAVTEQNPEKLGGTVSELSERLEVVPRAKMDFSCGACGDLFAAWQAAGLERILLCGIETHVCVQQTALDVMAAGYRVYIAADAVGARARLDHVIGLRRMESSGAVITTTEAALFEWCERAGTAEFRQISALVKESPPSAAS
jgi:nicotinamidase-related amidase